MVTLSNGMGIDCTTVEHDSSRVFVLILGDHRGPLYSTDCTRDTYCIGVFAYYPLYGTPRYRVHGAYRQIFHARPLFTHYTRHRSIFLCCFSLILFASVFLQNITLASSFFCGIFTHFSCPLLGV